MDVREEEVDVREGEVDVREGEVDVREGEVDVREGEVDMREGEVDVREGEVDVREGEVDVSEGEERGVTTNTICHFTIAHTVYIPVTHPPRWCKVHCHHSLQVPVHEHDALAAAQVPQAATAVKRTGTDSSREEDRTYTLPLSAIPSANLVQQREPSG